MCHFYFCGLSMRVSFSFVLCLLSLVVVLCHFSIVVCSEVRRARFGWCFFFSLGIANAR